jgi:hypothetical protein
VGFRFAVLALFALFAVSPVLLAQNAPADFSGIWTQPGNVGFNPDAGADTAEREMAAGKIPRWAFAREEPPMQPWAAERYRLNREGMRPPELGRNERNSLLYPYCLPEGMPRMMTIGTFEILHGKDIIYVMNERNHNVRRIYLDGKRHLDGMAPTFVGTSHGRWDRDTLFVETANINALDGYAWLDTFGHVFSDKLRVEERFRRTAPGTLQVDYLFDDPGAYTRPWNGVKVYSLEADWDMTENITCGNHRRELYLRDMRGGNFSGQP